MTDEEKFEKIEQRYQEAKGFVCVMLGMFVFGIAVGVVGLWCVQHIQFSWR